MILYSMPGCPMCDMLKEKLNEAGYVYEIVNDRGVLLEKGITHVPMLETDQGELLSLAYALRHIKGENV